MQYNKVKKYLIISLLSLLPFATIGQEYENLTYKELETTVKKTENRISSMGRVNSIRTIETIIDIAGKFHTSQEFYLKALSYNVLGKIHYLAKDYKKAIENFKIAELFLKEIKGYPDLRIDINNNIAVIYLEGYDKPGRALQKIKVIYESYTDLDPDLKHSIELNLANIYIQIKKYNKAYTLLKRCEKHFSDKPKLASSLSRTYASFGDYFAKKGKYDVGIHYYEKAADIAETNEWYRQAMEIYKKYEELLITIGRKDLAYTILSKYTKHQQTAFELEKSQADQFKQQLTVVEEKKTIETQKAEQSKNISILTLSLLVLCLIFFCFFIYNHKKTKVLSESLAVRNKELKRAKKESDKLAAVKTKFISTVSHELRTPLYGVIGLSTILQDRIKDEENQKFIKLMKFSANHLLNLINDVLQVSKMESYEIKLDESSLNLKTLAYNIKDSFQYQAEENGNTLNLNIDPDIPTNLIGDSIRLSQIFINLIGNANKFTKNGNIWLNFINPVIKKDTVAIRFEIKDEGRGIPEEKQKLIFEKFSQAEKNDHGTGTGLGLHIVKNLVELHGGEINIESTPGKGSTFYFTLSFKIDHQATETADIEESTSAIPLTETSDYTILIVEDNKINQVVTKNILKSRGYKSEIASDGLIAIDMASNNDYDLILMDLNMPNMGGMEATLKIREFNKGVPIVALTASDSHGTIKEILDPSSGFSDFLHKPYKNEEFFKKLEFHLREHNVSKAS
ncbi:ATP-binding protein [Aquimarina brevivitae]|uniref:histidine kinase n=1 Tax=Aquimarina brevivitae TaxID=323412 RepID=A0A4Q7NXC0_9FLAO|nr:ATP-binding protein [Aquimarina brevivitae]RZS92026.1 signal transduction histidine kinase [Aquimarina brevivitae]